MEPSLGHLADNVCTGMLNTAGSATASVKMLLARDLLSGPLCHQLLVLRGLRLLLQVHLTGQSCVLGCGSGHLLATVSLQALLSSADLHSGRL